MHRRRAKADPLSGLRLRDFTKDHNRPIRKQIEVKAGLPMKVFENLFCENRDLILENYPDISNYEIIRAQAFALARAFKGEPFIVYVLINAMEDMGWPEPQADRDRVIGRLIREINMRTESARKNGVQPFVTYEPEVFFGKFEPGELDTLEEKMRHETNKSFNAYVAELDLNHQLIENANNYNHDDFIKIHSLSSSTEQLKRKILGEWIGYNIKNDHDDFIIGHALGLIVHQVISK